MTIYFMVPDRAEPTGGIKVIYGIAQALRERGHEAYAWQSGSLRHPEALSSDTLKLRASDTLCVPEIGPAETRAALSNVPVVIVNQGHYHTMGFAELAEDVSQAYPRWQQVNAVIATSDAIAEYLRSIGIKSPLFPIKIYVDDIFQEPSSGLSERPHIVSFMPRRRETELRSLVNAMRRDARLRQWRFEEIDGLPPEGVARTLRKSRVFLHGAMQEGLGLPGLEAMAAGAHLAGFPGDGGREFMREENSLILSDGNLSTATRQFHDLLLNFDQRLPQLEQKAARARALVKDTYSWRLFVDRVDALQPKLEAAAVGRAVTVTHTTKLARQAARLPLRKRLGLIRRALAP